MFGLRGSGEVRDLSVEEVAAGMKEGKILLVDVREPRETEVERIPGSFLLPLSTFDPTEIPEPEGKTVVFSCRSGVRSVKASEIAQASGFAYDSHMAGGLLAWKEAGFATETG
jgi:rhodanese-related sulfurtransferase